MKLGVFTMLLGNKTLKDSLEFLRGIDVEMVELGTGGFDGKHHTSPEVLLANPKKLVEFKQTLADYNIKISALSCHGNPVHPIKEKADAYHKDFEQSVLLAEKLGLDRVVTFSGCPGDFPGAVNPNWVTCTWPGEFKEILQYQWEEVLIPYWKKAAAFALDHGVDKIAIEMHPGFSVYNPGTMMKLREAVGPVIGVNFDPAHLVWQGIHPPTAIKNMEGMIYHFHAKDTLIDKVNLAARGVLDATSLSSDKDRSWSFRTVGYGMDTLLWKEMIMALQMIGYDHVLSIEHEDMLMTVEEGITKAASFLNEYLIKEELTGFWWEE